MRRRLPPAGIRENLSAFYREMARLYDQPSASPRDRWSTTADAIDAGQPVVVHGYEVGAPGRDLVRVEPDGHLLPVAWNHSTRSYEAQT